MSDEKILDLIDNEPIPNDFFDWLEEEKKEAEKVADELWREWGF